MSTKRKVNFGSGEKKKRFIQAPRATLQQKPTDTIYKINLTPNFKKQETSNDMEYNPIHCTQLLMNEQHFIDTHKLKETRNHTDVGVILISSITKKRYIADTIKLNDFTKPTSFAVEQYVRWSNLLMFDFDCCVCKYNKHSSDPVNTTHQNIDNIKAVMSHIQQIITPTEPIKYTIMSKKCGFHVYTNVYVSIALQCMLFGRLSCTSSYPPETIIDNVSYMPVPYSSKHDLDDGYKLRSGFVPSYFLSAPLFYDVLSLENRAETESIIVLSANTDDDIWNPHISNMEIFELNDPIMTSKEPAYLRRVAHLSIVRSHKHYTKLIEYAKNQCFFEELFMETLDTLLFGETISSIDKTIDGIADMFGKMINANIYQNTSTQTHGYKALYQLMRYCGKGSSTDKFPDDCIYMEYILTAFIKFVHAKHQTISVREICDRMLSVYKLYLIHPICQQILERYNNIVYENYVNISSSEIMVYISCVRLIGITSDMELSSQIHAIASIYESDMFADNPFTFIYKYIPFVFKSQNQFIYLDSSGKTFTLDKFSVKQISDIPTMSVIQSIANTPLESEGRMFLMSQQINKPFSVNSGDFLINTEYGVFNSITGVYIANTPLHHFTKIKRYAVLPPDLDQSINGQLIKTQLGGLFEHLDADGGTLYQKIVIIPAFLSMMDRNQYDLGILLQVFRNFFINCETVDSIFILFEMHPFTLNDFYDLYIAQDIIMDSVNLFVDTPSEIVSDITNALVNRKPPTNPGKSYVDDNFIDMYPMLSDLLKLGESNNFFVPKQVLSVIILLSYIFRMSGLCRLESKFQSESPATYKSDFPFTDGSNTEYKVCKENTETHYLRTLSKLIQNDVYTINLLRGLLISTDFNIKLIIELCKCVSMLFNPTTSTFKHIVILKGCTNSGKSHILNLLKLMNEGSVCSRVGSIKKDNSQNKNSELYENYIAIFSELKYVDATILKSITGRDAESSRRLYSNHFINQNSQAFLIAATNSIITIKESGGVCDLATHKRLFIIPINASHEVTENFTSLSMAHASVYKNFYTSDYIQDERVSIKKSAYALSRLSYAALLHYSNDQYIVSVDTNNKHIRFEAESVLRDNNEMYRILMENNFVMEQYHQIDARKILNIDIPQANRKKFFINLNDMFTSCDGKYNALCTIQGRDLVLECLKVTHSPDSRITKINLDDRCKILQSLDSSQNLGSVLHIKYDNMHYTNLVNGVLEGFKFVLPDEDISTFKTNA